jgi:hypothetical protein
LKANWLLFDSSIARPATGGSLNVFLFGSIARPATGISCASNRCAGRQLKLTKTNTAVVESINFIFFNKSWLLAYFTSILFRMPN